ncbi:LysR family transcriptional regulator [Kiloniella majae]|uniref:LysR family transcriptional regulator n=1 Tax=Kiloniella majae TaxID=1938558 RepID=UPI000A278BD2|nr:LysR family transcriptional regulator [Kiloniella majae]
MKIDVSSLNMLRAFDAAARNLSFTLAAKELNVNQPAISRQISSLEMQLGTTLFQRTRPKLTLTADGQSLYSAVANGFTQIGTALDAIQNRNKSTSVDIRTTIGFASCFLINQLSGFYDLHPNTELELVTGDRVYEYDPTDFDVAVIFGYPEDFTDYKSHLIFPEVLLPICAPNYFTPEELTKGIKLADQKLLTFTEEAHLNNWETFFAETDETPKKSERSNIFNSFMVYFHAVLNGRGVALSWAGLIEDFIKTERLTIVGERYVRTNRGYHCCLSERGQRSASAKKFANWLIEETRISREEMLEKYK